MPKTSVVIVVPIYRAELSELECVALGRLQEVWGQYPRVFVAPASLAFDFGALGQGVRVERFPDRYFASTEAYSELLLTEAFYARFACYAYLVLYQTDAFVFYDALPQFCALGYDYIGAPVERRRLPWHLLGARVGNGGFSLRRVAACRRVLRAWRADAAAQSHPFAPLFRAWEDLFWGYCGTRPELHFSVPDVETALGFAVQGNVHRAYARLASGWRPCGCHGWNQLEFAGLTAAVAQLGYSTPGFDAAAHAQLQALRARRWQVWHGVFSLFPLVGALRCGDGAAAVRQLQALRTRYPAGTFWQERTEAGQLLRMAVAWRLTPAAQAACLQLMDAAEAREEKEQHMGKCIILVSMVKNEADIIESFVWHSLTYADRLIIADHQSSDGTWEILQKLQAEGLPLTLRRLYRVELAHREVMNGLVREAIAQGADIVLPFDADEFLVNTENELTCREVLESLDPTQLYGLHWRKYEPLYPERDLDQFLLARPCKSGADFAPAQKTIVGAASYTGPRRYELVQGAHYGEYLDTGESVPMYWAPYIHTAHFHWRSDAQFASKVATSWINNVAKYSQYTLTAAYLKTAYDQLERHETAQPDGLMGHDRAYDLTPYVTPQTLRYTSAQPADMTVNLMAAAERLAQQMAQMKALAHARRVSIVLIVNDDEAASLCSWQAALAQTYTLREFIVLQLTQAMPEALAQAIGEAQAAGEQVTCIDGSTGTWAAALDAVVQGDYVQWLLPGNVIRPDKVERMVTFLELQDQPFVFATATGSEAQDSEWQPGVCFPADEPVLAYLAQDFWSLCLQNGHYPLGGVASGLFPRELLSISRWLEGCFLEGRALEFVMWRELCRNVAQTAQPLAGVGVLHDTFCEVPPQVTAEVFLWHQLQWATLLEQAQDEEDAAVLRQGWRTLAARGRAVSAQARVLAQSPLYPAYQAMLVAHQA